MGENDNGQVRISSLTVCCHFYLPEHRQGDLDVMQRLLDALSMSLEELQLGYSVVIPEDDSEDGKSGHSAVKVDSSYLCRPDFGVMIRMSFALCTKLHTLTVDLTYGEAVPDFSWILQMVSSTSLRELRMKVSFSEADEVEWIPWAKIHLAIVEG